MNKAEELRALIPELAKAGFHVAAGTIRSAADREEQMAEALRNLLKLYRDDEGCRSLPEYKGGVAALRAFEGGENEGRRA